jgi:hypothetical protein
VHPSSYSVINLVQFLTVVSSSQMVIAVAVDVSQPDCATTLFSWLALVNATLDRYIARCNEEHISSALSSSSSSAGVEESKDKHTDPDTDPDTGKPPPSCARTRPPVLVVGCKADTLEASDVEGMARSKAVQGALRAVCLHGECEGGREGGREEVCVL